MKTGVPQKKLQTRISLIATVAVILILIAVGFYFDQFLRERFLETTRKRMEHSFQMLSYDLKQIERQLKEGISFAGDDEQLIASIDLINNYQDKQNYNTFLIDEEKKNIAGKLLGQVKLTFNSDINIFDINGELLAYVHATAGGYQLNYISYDGGEVNIMSRHENERIFSDEDSSMPRGISTTHKHHSASTTLQNCSNISYHQFEDSIVMKSHQSIFDNITGQLIAHIEMSKVLDRDYFAQLSRVLDVEISYAFESLDGADAAAFGEDKKLLSLNISRSKDEYHSTMVRKSSNGSIFFTAGLGTDTLHRTLNENRRQLLILLLGITAVVLLLMRTLINRSVARPLITLMEQIARIEQHDYSRSQKLTTGDELEVISTNIDKLAEVIQERETHLHTLIKTIPDLVWLKDPDGVFIHCNHKFERLLGEKMSQVVGKTDYDFMDKEQADFFREKDRITIAAGVPSTSEEERIYADDGHKEILETIKTPMFDAEGKLIGILGVGRDITARKQAELALEESREQLSLALHGANLGLWDWRPQSNELFTNDIFLTMLGYETDAFPETTERWSRLVHPHDLEQVLATLQPFLDGDDGNYRSVYRLRAADETYRWIEDVGRVVARDAEGKAVRFVGVHIDITEQKKI